MKDYSIQFKEDVVKKRLSGRPIKEIRKDTGLSNSTIYNWIKLFKKGALTDKVKYPGNFSSVTKYNLLTESYLTPKENMGKWLREKGVHPDHLEKWDLEIKDIMTKPNKEREEIRRLKEENKNYQKELRKKDKALAEAAALLVLKKKYQYLWEEEEK